MITGEIKNKIDKIWIDLWAGGITNPLTVIEQITYLMFIRSLDEKELQKPPFDKPISFTKLFDAKRCEELIKTINSIKENATRVV